MPHPYRIEQLIHFELEECRYALRWCQFHQRSHIEWFKVDLDKAKSIAQLWVQWMQRANPYDRRGHLKRLWQGHIGFLVEHENPITAEAMAQIQRIEPGSREVQEFINDQELRKRRDMSVKKEILN